MNTGKSLLTATSIPILSYHSIDDSGSVLSTPLFSFRRHLETLHQMGMTTVTVLDIAACLRAREALPRHTIALTFDDGFTSVYEYAFPLLCKYRFSATVFLVTDYCGGLNDWPGQPQGIPRQPLLQWSQIEEMSRYGIQFGAHSKTHPDLRRLSAGDLETEIGDSKRVIEDRLGQAVYSFAYPYGYFDARVLTVVREHFTAACSTELAFVQEGSNPWCLERIDAYYLRSRLFPRHLISPLAGTYLRMRWGLRALRRSYKLGEVQESLLAKRPTAT